MQTVCSFFARFCISSIFIFTALQELISWNAQERYFYDVLSAIWSSGVWGKVMTETLGWALENFLVVFSAAIFLKLLGGICVLFSWKPKFALFYFWYSFYLPLLSCTISGISQDPHSRKS